jgi:hypothetical protein
VQEAAGQGRPGTEEALEVLIVAGSQVVAIRGLVAEIEPVVRPAVGGRPHAGVPELFRDPVGRRGRVASQPPHRGVAFLATEARQDRQEELVVQARIVVDVLAPEPPWSPVAVVARPSED